MSETASFRSDRYSSAVSSRRVPYRKFAQSVRRYDTHLLLERIASASVELQRATAGMARPQWNTEGPVRQFSLAAVARTALVEHGRRKKPTPSRPVTRAELHKLCALMIDTDHPDVPEVGAIKSPAMKRMFARLMYQQGVFEYSAFENITRSIGLLVEHDATACELPTPTEWVEQLGVTLPDYMTIAFQLASLATTYGGRISHDTIRECHALGLFTGVNSKTVESVIQRHFAAPLRAHVALARRGELPDAKMWSHNPLMAQPLIDENENGYLLPIHHYLIEKITPLGLFFTGLQAFGERFAGELGKSFELYIGRHLALLKDAGASIYAEITYGPGNKKTIDYFVVFDEIVILVEVKSFKATAPARAGIDTGLDALVDKVQGARNQIDKTAGLLMDGVPELAHIPSDRPLRGLVVTAEPLHNMDTFLYRDMFDTNTIESSTASAHDVERICPTLAKLPDAGHRLLDALTFSDPTPPSLGRAIEGLPVERNPVSDALWQQWEKVAPMVPSKKH